ncbi:MAG: hypothetical protein A3F14_04660 [Gammaproteobacteria bacterium RIFCSPHIGHO2_12_FULL_43_28]|nr:MAG: hypothetical protein A3F14_04660 [Gammaproteobacteria bacterium RIFCSPHIGHO2_12_FULL_43_28]
MGIYGFSLPFYSVSKNTIATSPRTSKSWVSNETQLISTRNHAIDTKVLHLSLLAYANAQKKGLVAKPLLTVIDYSRPSTEKRLWVFDLRNGKALFNTYVSHGKNSGAVNATSFSNSPGSLKSSIGVFVTDDSPYIGGKGLAIRLKGLERGVNDNAFRRNVVIHGAWYVNTANIKKNGYIGRSWGCPAVSTDLIKPIINTIKDKTMIVAYYPDRYWLNHSPFLVS